MLNYQKPARLQGKASPLAIWGAVPLKCAWWLSLPTLDTLQKKDNLSHLVDTPIYKDFQLTRVAIQLVDLSVAPWSFQVAPLQLTEEPLDVRSFSHKGTLLRQRASAEPQWHQDMIVKKMIVMTPIVNDTS